jgi:GNAT superfamily N-acetyltransferase
MTRTQSTTIRPATPSDVDTVTDVLTEAFLISPIGSWLISDVDIRRSVYRRYFRLHADHALDRGAVDITTDGNAVAVWWSDPTCAIAPGHAAHLADACGDWLHRFQLIDKLFDAVHPAAVHHYLAYLAVAPPQQEQGRGTALLEHYHRDLDAIGVPAYLEASTERNRDLYLRHGYVLSPAAPAYLPEAGPPVWPMWRDPRRATDQNGATAG